jgi:UDP-glucose 4-epimerase
VAKKEFLGLRVLVTGANGFLGRHVVAELLRRGHSVRAMVRPAAKVDAQRLGWDGEVELFRADLRASRELPAAFEGVDALVHLAAAVTGGEEVQFAASVVGTERLLAAMATSRCDRLVLASSFSVYDWSAIRGSLTEDSPLEADLYSRDGYAVAKFWQEKVARRLAEEHRWRLTVLRPGFIWGRGNEYLFGIGQTAGPVEVVIGPTRRMPLTHVENCADAFATATERDAAVGQTFNVIDGHNASVWRYAGEYHRRSGVRRRRVPVPYWLGMLGTRVIQRTSKVIFRGKGKLPSLFVPCRFEARFKPLRFPNDRLRDVLGWTPRLGFEECLRRTYEVQAAVEAAAPVAVQAPELTHA